MQEKIPMDVVVDKSRELSERLAVLGRANVLHLSTCGAATRGFVFGSVGLCGVASRQVMGESRVCHAEVREREPSFTQVAFRRATALQATERCVGDITWF